jgi:hypothetical protein
VKEIEVFEITNFPRITEEDIDAFLSGFDDLFG